ncbi:MAG: helix-hairpin-helix domain-containing protein [Candidatus Marinimicrobia bacterium]|nr:helix-hairpin-helix domain-containing protein [Candidatus Neomarinimicrobiota bacterium]MCF7850879.1 helix-hairpin-helix domain-containing protein [Candidatus Neomarinimicrobiota bacterium]MCF7904168.1 helix-hairpin-helix domain-containing protein [Candidatus Neomarinimicrobiota bacterium]
MLHRTSILLRLICLMLPVYLLAEPLDINNADEAEIMDLAIRDEAKIALIEYLEQSGPIESFYDLSEVPALNSKDLQTLKSLISIYPERQGSLSRLRDNYRRVEQWTSQEGASEGLIELWLERLAEPININTASYEDIISFQNVTPVDAVAILKLREQMGELRYQRALRNAIGLSYYGYRNLRDFVRFDDEDQGQWHLWYTTVMKTIPSTNSTDEELANPIVRKYPPDLVHKLSFSNSRHWKVGLAYNRQLGEGSRYFPGTDIPEIKAALTLSDYDFGPIHLDRLILGSFNVTFGQGVVMENTDFRAPRRSGYGWQKRVPGIFTDLSRSQEFAFRGVGIQGRIFDKLVLMGFASKNDRDAVLNSDGTSFTSLITLYPRQNTGLLDDLNNPLLDVVNEVTYGGLLRYEFAPGTFIGVSSYESLYDKELRPEPLLSVIATDSRYQYLSSIGNAADSEIEALYASSSTSPLWGAAKAHRRVMGLEFNTVIQNLALQGELGILDKDGSLSVSADDPKALILSAYLQFDNLNLLMLYRDTDLAFDNPYQRSFSNYQKFKSTIFEDEYYLIDPIYSHIYSSAVQPQAERGVYLRSRYQMHRRFVVTTDFDTWTRVPDGANYHRTKVRLEFRPTFNYRITLSHKWQKRSRFNLFSPTGYENIETIIRSRLRLSKFNELSVQYTTTKTIFDPRKRLVIDLDEGVNYSSDVGNALSPSQALNFAVTHNVNDRFRIKTAVTAYKGFIWTFEDTDFRVFNSLEGNLRYWVSTYTRLGDRWSMRMKYSSDMSLPTSNYAYQSATESSRKAKDNIISWSNQSDFRFQLDYAF